MNIPTEKLAVTVYAGDENVPYDQEAHDLWKDLGISEKHIASTKEDNFWAAGETGPCGTDTEIFYFRSNDEIPETFDTQLLKTGKTTIMLIKSDQILLQLHYIKQ